MDFPCLSQNWKATMSSGAVRDFVGAVSALQQLQQTNPPPPSSSLALSQSPVAIFLSSSRFSHAAVETALASVFPLILIQASSSASLNSSSPLLLQSIEMNPAAKARLSFLSVGRVIKSPSLSAIELLESSPDGRFFRLSDHDGNP